jgi:hypothetical protein
MDVAAGFVTAVGVGDALDEDLHAPPRLLPSSAVASALIGKRDDVAQLISQQINGRFVPARHEIIAVSKARHGVRPVAVWDLSSRLLYRILTQRVAPLLPVPERTRQAWKDFERSPLSSPAKYVVAADIASCYQLIDHELLAQELLVQTGDSETVNHVLTLLCLVSGQSYGLPQQSVSSDILAEAFLDRLERALLRRRLNVIRYNDDFRFNCDSWSEVIRSIEALSDEARSLGLVLNDSKTLTWTMSKYEDHLNEMDYLRNDIADEAELDLTKYVTVEDYDSTQTVVIEPDRDDVEFLAASQVLERWSRVAGRGRVSDRRKAEHRALMQLVPLSLALLGKFPYETPEILDNSMKLLRYEQTMTPHVCRYLNSRVDEDAVLAAFDRLMRKRAYMTGWQIWWLQEPLARLSNFSDGRSGEKRVNWIKDSFQASENSPILRVQTALTLARHRQISVDELIRIYDRSTPVVRPVVVAAVGLLKPSANVRRGVTQSKLDQWIFDWARQHA